MTVGRIARSRWRSLGASLVGWAALVVLYLVLQTIASAYPGPLVTVTSPYTVSSTETLVEAEAGPCRREGPVSGSGFGYWWTCQAVIRRPDGATALVELRSSTLTPDDTGTRVTLEESCGAGGGCAYGRPGYGGWTVPMRLLTYVIGIAVVAALVMACAGVVHAVLGPPRRPTLMLARRRADELGDAP